MPTVAVARFTIRSADLDAKAAWNAVLHPRDARGRFIRKDRKSWEPNAFSALMDPRSPVTSAVLTRRLADGEGLYADRQKWLRAVNRLDRMADKGEQHSSWPTVKDQMETNPAPAIWVSRNLKSMATADVRAAAVRHLERELRRRSSGSTGMAGGYRADTNEDGKKWALEHLPTPFMTTAQFSSVYKYTGSSARINGELRNPGSENDLTREHIKSIRAVFDNAKAPEDLIVFRGAGSVFVEAIGGNLDNDASMHGLVGKVVDSPTFQSTTIGASALRGFAKKPVQWMLRVPKGHPALFVDRPGITQVPGEQEVLLPDGTRRVIHAAYRNPNNPRDPRWYIEAEVVPSGWTPTADWVPRPVGDAHAGYETSDYDDRDDSWD